jgi:hypothetical protein
VLLEPYIFSILHAEGRWDPTPLVDRICRGEVGLVVVDYPLEVANTAYHGYAHWPWPIFEALRQAMAFEASPAERFVYTPRARPTDRPRGGTNGTSCAPP